MSFDLCLWDADRPPTVADAGSRYEQVRAGRDPADGRSERVDAFADECDRRWPSGPEGADRPFAGRRTPSAFLATVRPDAATALFGEMVEMAERLGLILYDPQSGIIKIPSRLSFECDPPEGRVNRRSLRRLLKRRRVQQPQLPAAPTTTSNPP